MKQGHVNFFISGMCFVLLGWMVLMCYFTDIEEGKEKTEDTTKEEIITTSFCSNTEPLEASEEVTKEIPAPETKAVKTAEIEREMVCEDTEVVEVVEVEEVDPSYMGNYMLTAYCPCSYCCGKSDGITSTGVKAQAGRTIAVDPREIPYGTEVVINGHTYIAEDCGGSIKGNRIDVYFDTHTEASQFGIQYADVYVKI